MRGGSSSSKACTQDGAASARIRELVAALTENVVSALLRRARIELPARSPAPVAAVPGRHRHQRQSVDGDDDWQLRAGGFHTLSRAGEISRRLYRRLTEAASRASLWSRVLRALAA